MILECYSVFDKAVGAFMPPFYAKSRGEALRMFMDACADTNSSLHKHPGDYTLFRCGEFEDGVGIFASREPERVLGALECLAVEYSPDVVPMKGGRGA